MNISLQREKKKDAEIKVGVAYRGKDKGKTVDKVIHLALEKAESFWQGITTKTAKAFNLSKIVKVFVGGDGASFVLSRFHLKRALTTCLGWTSKATLAYKNALSGNLSSTLSRLDEEGKNNPDKTEVTQRVKRYLISNADGLSSKASLGAIESNVDKLVANRMKKRGMSWTISGARRMLKLIEANLGDEVLTWLTSQKKTKNQKIPQLAIQQVKEALTEDPERWLRAHLAPLDGPHSSRPWVKVLREIARGSPLESTGVVPTKT